MAGVYTTLIRGVPDLVLMLLIFFGGQMLVNQIAESLGYEDYIEVSAVHRRRADDRLHLRRLHDRDLPRRHPGGAAGQLEAGQAFGMSRWQVFRGSCCRRPSATPCPASATTGWCCSRPPRCCRSSASTTCCARPSQAAGATREPFTFYLAAALIYLLLTTVSTVLLSWAERRAEQPYRRPAHGP